MPYPDNMDWRAFDAWTMPPDPPPVATGRCTNCDDKGWELLPMSGKRIACSECNADGEVVT